jgi:small subunit ribosomal protein S6
MNPIPPDNRRDRQTKGGLMAIYETIFILDSLIPPKDIETAIQKYSSIITENGGTVRKVDKWGKRRLAYEIQKKQYGYYVAIEFEGPGPIPRLLEADYNYNDKVLRFLTYRYDKNKLKSMEMEEKNRQKKAEAEDSEITSSASEEKSAGEETKKIEEESTSEEKPEEKAEEVEEEAAEEEKVSDEEGEEEKS